MENKLTPTPQTGAFTLVLLAKNYKPQMVSLLIRNGIIANNSMSDAQLAGTMANLLKVSVPFKKDMENFLNNPQVAQKVMGGFANFTEEAKFFNFTADNKFFNFADETIPFCQRPENANLTLCKKDVLTPTGSNTTTTTTTTASQSPSFWSGLLSQVPNYLNQGLGLLGSLDKNKTDREIADAQARIAMYQAQGLTVDPTTGLPIPPAKTGWSTGAIVGVTFAGVALLAIAGYAIYKAGKS